jgi:hypothetical protein
MGLLNFTLNPLDFLNYSLKMTQSINQSTRRRCKRSLTITRTLLSTLLLSVLSPAFAQTTNVIPTGGEWRSGLRQEPFDNMESACNFGFDLLYKNKNPDPACAITKFSGKKLYVYTALSDTEGIGIGQCYVSVMLTELKKINDKPVRVCTKFQEHPVPIAVLHTPAKQTCPVEPLKPITDPEALRIEGGDDKIREKLTPGMKKSLACLENAGVGFKLTSAWRPKAYQDHFYEIYTKLLELDKRKNKTNPACKPIRDAIEVERAKHKIANLLKNNKGRKRVAESSKHSLGLAFDGGWTVNDAKLDKVANSCGVYRRIKEVDPPHFEPL